LKTKIEKELLNTKNLYKLKIGDMKVEIEYSENNKTFNECILNILKKVKNEER